MVTIVKADSYLSLARNYSFVVILLVFIAVQGTQTYTIDMWQIGKARELFIDALIDSQPWERPSEKKDAYELKVDGLEPMRYEFLEGVRSKEDPIIDFGGTAKLHLRFFYDGANSWASPVRSVLPREPDPITGKIEAQHASSLSALRDLHRQIFGIDLPANRVPLLEADAIRKKIELHALERRTAVPGIGLEFRNGIAPWFIALTVLGLIVQIRNQVRRTFLDPELAINEPWLLLDGRRGLEKIVAGGWALALVMAPWITTGCLIAVSTVESMTDGWVTGIAQETIFHVCLASLLVFGGWSSLTMFGELLRLRRMRLEKLRTLAPQSSMG
jgi:hypothetical protein